MSKFLSSDIREVSAQLFNEDGIETVLEGVSGKMLLEAVEDGLGDRVEGLTTAWERFI